MARTLGLRGIDISQHQVATPPNLSSLAFIVLRSSISQTVDTRYAQHYAAARKAGLVVMAYHFAYSADQSSIPEQVKVFLATAKDADFLWLDQEEAGFDDAQAQKFIDLVRAAGRPCGLYHSASGFGGVDSDAQWVADYRAASVSAGYPMKGDASGELTGWDLWQWSSTGSLPDYSGNLDMNWLNPASKLASLLRVGYVPQATVDAAAKVILAEMQEMKNQIASLEEQVTQQGVIITSQNIDLSATKAALEMAQTGLAAAEAALADAPRKERERIAEVERQRILNS